MTAEQAFEALCRQLRGADDKTLLKIVGVVDRLAKRGPLDRLLDAHRLRLAAIRPPRPLSLPRLVVLPFEQLVVDPATWSPGQMRIPRNRLGQLIKRAFTQLDDTLKADLAARIAGRTMEDAATVLEVGRSLWPAAAAAVCRVLEEARRTRDPTTCDLLLPLRVAQHLLPVAEPLVTTVWALPAKPMHALDAGAKAKIADLMELASEQGRDCFRLVAELLVSRSELPLSIIEPVISGDFRLGVRERQQAAAMIAETCQGDMVRLLRTVAARPPEAAEPRMIVGAVQAIVSNVESLLEVATRVKFDHRELRRLKADVFDLIEARLADALNGLLFRAFEALADAAAPIDWHGLEQNATAAANLRLMAKRVGLASKIDFIFDRAEARYRSILFERCGRAPEEPAIDALAMDRLRIIELLFGSRVAMQMLTELRRGRPARLDQRRRAMARGAPCAA